MITKQVGVKGGCYLSMRLWRALKRRDLHSYESPFSHDPCSPSWLSNSGTTRLFRSGDVSPYQNIQSSLAPLRVWRLFEEPELCCWCCWGGWFGKQSPPNSDGKAEEPCPPGLEMDELGILLQTQRMSLERHLQYEESTGSFKYSQGWCWPPPMFLCCPKTPPGPGPCAGGVYPSEVSFLHLMPHRSVWKIVEEKRGSLTCRSL